jgi:hypothetical protein
MRRHHDSELLLEGLEYSMKFGSEEVAYFSPGFKHCSAQGCTEKKEKYHRPKKA